MKGTLQSYSKLGPEVGFTEALKMLKRRLGDEQEHIEEMVWKLQKGPTVKGDVTEALQDLVDELWNCTVNMENAGRIHEIDTYTCVAHIAE